MTRGRGVEPRLAIYASAFLIASTAALLTTSDFTGTPAWIVCSLGQLAIICSLLAPAQRLGSRVLAPSILVVAISVLLLAPDPIIGQTDTAHGFSGTPGWLIVIMTLTGSRILSISCALQFARFLNDGKDAAQTVSHQSVGSALLLGIGLTVLFHNGLSAWAPRSTDPAMRMILAALNGATIIHHAIILLFFIITAGVTEQAWLRKAPGRQEAVTVDPGNQRACAERSDEVSRRFFRSLVPMLPLLGFVGTVIGLAQAMADLPHGLVASGGTDFTATLSSLAIKFETTLLGLLGSMIATFLLALLDKSEADNQISRQIHATASRTHIS